MLCKAFSNERIVVFCNNDALVIAMFFHSNPILDIRLILKGASLIKTSMIYHYNCAMGKIISNQID